MLMKGSNKEVSHTCEKTLRLSIGSQVKKEKFLDAGIQDVSTSISIVNEVDSGDESLKMSQKCLKMF